MKLISKLYLSFGLVMAIAIASVVMFIWSAGGAAYHLERTHFAHEQYEGYLALSSHTYQLFKQLGDRMLIGDLDQRVGEAGLIRSVRDDIVNLRHLIGLEIPLVGDEELEELDRLAKIERVIESLLAEYMLLSVNPAFSAFRTDWGRLSKLLTSRSTAISAP